MSMSMRILVLVMTAMGGCSWTHKALDDGQHEANGVILARIKGTKRVPVHRRWKLEDTDSPGPAMQPGVNKTAMSQYIFYHPGQVFRIVPSVSLSSLKCPSPCENFPNSHNCCRIWEYGRK